MESYSTYSLVTSFFCLTLCLRVDNILVWNCSSVIFIVVQNSLTHREHYLFIHSVGYEQLGSWTPKFQFGATTNYTAINIFALVSQCTQTHISLGEHCWATVCRYSTSLDDSQLSSEVFAPIYTPNSNPSDFLLLYVLAYNWYCQSFKF